MKDKELVAAFMGYTRPHPDYPHASYWYKEGKPPLVHLLYDENWNWLMDVVEKIQTLGYFPIFAPFIEDEKGKLTGEYWCMISKQTTNMNDPVVNIHSAVSNIDVVYKAVVEFINWHNKELVKKTYDILENNSMIAEFMGLKEDPIFSEIDKERAEKGLPKGEPMYTTKEGYTSNLQYNSSWDWLMKVVEHIENTFEDVNILFFLNGCSIESTNFSIDIDRNTKIEAVYKAIIEFINWYNENNNDTHSNNSL